MLLTEALARRAIARPPFEPLWYAVERALGIVLSDSEIRDFEATVRTRLVSDYTDLFTDDELAGNGRQRGEDDPWPDNDKSGYGWAKKLLHNVQVGEIVAKPGAAALESSANWCRVEWLTDTEVGLQTSAGEPLVWTPNNPTPGSPYVASQAGAGTARRGRAG